MDLQFNQRVIKCLQSADREYQTQEQTLEIRIPDGMPDIAMVLACWGQPVLRGKEWRADHLGVTGGVMAKILYLPEEAGPVQTLEAWLPLQMKWTIPNSRQDGTMLVDLGLRSADARVLSARKLMVRTNVGALLQTLTPMELSVSQSQDLPEDVQLLTNQYYLSLPREAGEKAFGLDETLQLPASDPKPERIVRFRLTPQVLEQKVLSDKLIFRGLCILHLLYQSEDGQLHSRDLDVPFSQYTDLSEEFAPEATVQIWPVVTNLELERTGEGDIHLKAGLSGQYVIHDRLRIDVPQDAYSAVRPVELQMTSFMAPGLLDQKVLPVTAQADPQVDVMKPVDVAFWREMPYISRDGGSVSAELCGTFQMLYYDPEGQLQCTQTRWEQTLPLPTDGETDAEVSLRVGGKPQYSTGMLQADLLADYEAKNSSGIEMIRALELGERTNPDPQRPSLILTKAGTRDLWQIAKDNATTVSLIKEANGLEGEPAPDAVLLIPVI